MHCCTNSVKESYFAAKDYLLSLQRILFTCQTTVTAAKWTAYSLQLAIARLED